MVTLDGYVLQARLFPAVLALAPAIAFLFASVAASYDSLGLPQVLLTVAVGVLFFALSDLTRRLGLRAERSIFASSGGRPFPTVLRHGDKTIDMRSKARYHRYLSSAIGEHAPSPSAEATDPVGADAFYVACGNWLRECTRDPKVFHLLFSENVAYGFRRNLFGLKWIGLILNGATVLLCLWLVAKSENELLPQYGAVLVVAGLHALYFSFGVTRGSVEEASRSYGRQLVLSCETLIKEERSDSQ